jgi:hypothetical protein
LLRLRFASTWPRDGPRDRGLRRRWSHGGGHEAASGLAPSGAIVHLLAAQLPLALRRDENTWWNSWRPRLNGDVVQVKGPIHYWFAIV